MKKCHPKASQNLHFWVIFRWFLEIFYFIFYDFSLQGILKTTALSQESEKVTFLHIFSRWFLELFFRPIFAFDLNTRKKTFFDDIKSTRSKMGSKNKSEKVSILPKIAPKCKNVHKKTSFFWHCVFPVMTPMDTLKTLFLNIFFCKNDTFSICASVFCHAAMLQSRRFVVFFSLSFPSFSVTDLHVFFIICSP